MMKSRINLMDRQTLIDYVGNELNDVDFRVYAAEVLGNLPINHDDMYKLANRCKAEAVKEAVLASLRWFIGKIGGKDMKSKLSKYGFTS